MKKILDVVLVAFLCISLSGCGTESIDKELAFENMRNYFINDFRCEDYYIQMSQTQDQSHIMTEISAIGDDCAFLEYDYSGALKFFRNDKLTTISPQTYYNTESCDAKWTDFSYNKTAENYRQVLFQLCQNDKTNSVEEIKIEKNENDDFPYKISVYFDLEKINAKELFNSGGNFGSVSIKFLCDENGKNIDDISLNVQYDYNSKIYIISAYYGEPNLPDKDGNNGQRPEDIQEIFEDYSEDMQNSFEEYLNSIQSNFSQNIAQ